MAVRGYATDVDDAVQAAKVAFEDGAWSRAKPEFRRKVLFRAADLMEARSDEIVQLQSLEMGAPIGPEHAGVHPMINRSAWNLRFLQKNKSWLVSGRSIAMIPCSLRQCQTRLGCLH